MERLEEKKKRESGNKGEKRIFEREGEKINIRDVEN